MFGSFTANLELRQENSMELIFFNYRHFRILITGLILIGVLVQLTIDDNSKSSIDDNTISSVTIAAQSEGSLFIPTISVSPYGQCSTQKWAYLDIITSPRLYPWEHSSDAASKHSRIKSDHDQPPLETPEALEPPASSQPVAIQHIDLFDVAVDFLERLKSKRKLSQIDANLPDDSQHLGFVGTLTFTDNILKRLPTYRSLFEKIGSEHNLDWRLLAAMAYQESLWNDKAVSPTGVKGLMMLTRTTAKELGIKNRLDPEQSARGGARYFNHIKRRLPKKITGEDRLCMALASYNVGYGHLQDARILTRKLGGNPNKWADVKKRLPLLSKRKWYRKTKYGYARGHEPVRYVRNIQTYYNLLVWFTREEKSTKLAKSDVSERSSSTL